jgi:hypothetical protein
VAFRSYLDRDEIKERFNNGNVPLNHSMTKDGDDSVKKAEIWEIWDKKSGNIIWVCPDYQYILDEDTPPVSFDDYFPCPKPRYAVETNNTLEPIPEFCLYQDQADELDKITGRIDKLIDGLKVVGVYAAGAQGIEQMLDSTQDNVLIPIEEWAMFAEKGGLDKAISWFPVDQVINVLAGLYEARDKAKQELYEVSGFSDLVRGQSDPDETATAQRIKGQFASKRISSKQKDMAKFYRDILKLKSEIICEHFSKETLEAMTGLEVPDQVIALFRDENVRPYKIDIETDSTVEPDEQADKEARIEYLSVIGDFMQKALPVAQSDPGITPLLGEMLLFAARGFKAGRELEQIMEEYVERAGQAASQPKQPDPKQEAELAKEQAETQREVAETNKTNAETQQIVNQNQVAQFPVIP